MIKLVEGNFRTAVQVRPPGGPVADVQLLDQPPHSGPVPSVAVDGSGRFTAVWVEGGDVQIAQLAPGTTTFGAPTQITTDTAVSAFVDADSAGNTTIVWSSSAPAAGGGGNIDYRLRATTIPVGGGTGTTQELDHLVDAPPTATMDFFSTLRVNSSGAAAVMWLARASNAGTNGFLLRVALRKAAGDSFDSAIPIDTQIDHTPKVDGEHYIDYPMLDLNDAGDVDVFWVRATDDSTFPYTPWELNFQPGTLSGGFGAVDPVPIDPTDLRGLGNLAVDPAGRAVFAFRKYPFSDLTVRPNAIFRPRGGPWGTAQEIAPTTDVGETDLAVGPDGTVMYTYTGYQGSSASANTAIAPPGGAFGSPHQFAKDVNSLQRARAAMGPTGDGAVAWVYQSGSAFVTDASGYDVSPPTLRNVVIPASGTAGSPLDFSVQPFDIWSPVTTSWAFGDGATGDGTSVSHSYADGGDKAVSVTATDAFGNAASSNGTVAVTSVPVVPGPIPAGADTTKPVASGFAASPSTFAVGPKATPLVAKVARGTTFKFQLSEAGSVAITIARQLPGKRSGKRCVAPTKKLRKKKSCKRYKTVGTLKRTGVAGANMVAFSGRLAKRALALGRYRATIVATDAAGNKSVAKTASFRLVKFR
jgi:hypothetical protein